MRGKRGLRPKNSGQHGRGHERVVSVTGCAGVGFGGNSGGRFSARGGRWRL